MKPEKVSVLVGKKKTELIKPVKGADGKVKRYSWSWNVHYGVTATLDPHEKYEDVLNSLSLHLKKLVNESLGEDTPVQLKLVINH